MYNYLPPAVLFDFLLYPFCCSGNIPLFSRKPEISSEIIPVSSFHVKGRHVMGHVIIVIIIARFFQYLGKPLTGFVKLLRSS